MLATMDINELLTNKKLMAAFQMFDKDGNGEISVDEIISVVGGKGNKQEKNEWKDVLKDIDIDGNGEISFEEFKIMMLKLAH